VGLAVATDPGVLHLRRGVGDAGTLGCEAGLQRDVHRVGVDRERGDQDPLQQLVRVRAHQRTVLERGRLALRGIAHDEAPPGSAAYDARPLAPGREAGAATTAQSRARDLLERSFGSDLVRTSEPETTDLSGEVRIQAVDGRGRKQVRRHPAGVPEPDVGVTGACEAAPRDHEVEHQAPRHPPLR
jgi:hypothetical protein